MTTFSQLVDYMVAELKRPDLKAEVCSYLNQAIREVHAEPRMNNTVLFAENRQELQLVSSASDNLIWPIPNPTIFQKLEAVQYASIWSGGQPIYAKEMKPGPALGLSSYCYYRVGAAFAFKGFGGLNSIINLSYFEYPRSLVYYEPLLRPAGIDPVTGTWIYSSQFDVSDSTRAQAQLLTTNWLLMRWSMALEEALRAKVYKRLSDTERARTSYSMYQSLRQQLYTAETI